MLKQCGALKGTVAVSFCVAYLFRIWDSKRKFIDNSNYILRDEHIIIDEQYTANVEKMKRLLERVRRLILNTKRGLIILTKTKNEDERSRKRILRLYKLSFRHFQS